MGKEWGLFSDMLQRDKEENWVSRLFTLVSTNIRGLLCLELTDISTYWLTAELTSLLLSTGELISTLESTYLKKQKDAEIALQDWTAIFQNGGLWPSFISVLTAKAASILVLLVEKEWDAPSDGTRIHQDGGRVLGWCKGKFLTLSPTADFTSGLIYAEVMVLLTEVCNLSGFEMLRNSGEDFADVGKSEL